MVLRLSRDGASFTLTLPKRQSLTSAKAFLDQSKLWMQNTLAHRGRKDGDAVEDVITLRGVTFQLLRTGKTRGLVHQDEAASTCMFRVLMITGSAASPIG